jgi:glucose uptake protein GlcU
MDVQTLLVTVLVLLTLAALGGLAMAAMRFGAARNPPAWLSMLHGMLGAAGLTLLVFAAFTADVPAMASLSALLLVVAAIGGAYMNLVYHWHGRLLPKALLIGHALLAVLGYVALLLAVRG